MININKIKDKASGKIPSEQERKSNHSSLQGSISNNDNIIKIW